MFNASSLYFTSQFGLSTESAAAVSSIFGWMNLFTRAVGGIISDWANIRCGMRGRLWTQALILAIEAAFIFVFVFAQASILTGSIIVMVFFSGFTQAAEGSTYAIVPYVSPPNTGAVSGVVGAGTKILNSNLIALSYGFVEMYSHPFFFQCPHFSQVGALVHLPLVLSRIESPFKWSGVASSCRHSYHYLFLSKDIQK